MITLTVNYGVFRWLDQTFVDSEEIPLNNYVQDGGSSEVYIHLPEITTIFKENPNRLML